MRIWRVILKELRSFFRDRGFVAAMFVAPFALMAVFGYTFQGELKDLPATVTGMDAPKVEALAAAVERSPFFRLVPLSAETAPEALRRGDVRAWFHLLSTGETRLSVDSSDYLVYHLATAGAAALWQGDFTAAMKREGSWTEVLTALREVENLASRADENFERQRRDLKVSSTEQKQLLTDLKTIDWRLRELRQSVEKTTVSFTLSELSVTYLFGEVSYFAYLTPAIMSLILFFIGLVITTINLVDERNQGTLFRLGTTPLRWGELFIGKFAVFSFIGLVEVLYVLALAVWLYRVEIHGSLFLALLLFFFLIAASTGLGLLLSAVVKTMRQAVILLPLVVIPSVLLSQTFSPVEVMPWFMQRVAYLSPLYYANVALRAVMIKGASLNEVWPQVLVLIIYALMALFVGILVFRKKMN